MPSSVSLSPHLGTLFQNTKNVPLFSIYSFGLRVFNLLSSANRSPFFGKYTPLAVDISFIHWSSTKEEQVNLEPFSLIFPDLSICFQSILIWHNNGHTSPIWEQQRGWSIFKINKCLCTCCHRWLWEFLQVSPLQNVMQGVCVSICGAELGLGFNNGPIF